MAWTLRCFTVLIFSALGVVHSWSCPDGYAGPEQCRGGHCDGNDVVLGGSDGGCCDLCLARGQVKDHVEYLVGKLCLLEQQSQCCNCWRWTGRRLNATLPRQEPPSLRGSGSGRQEAELLGNDSATGQFQAADEPQATEAADSEFNTTAFRQNSTEEEFITSEPEASSSWNQSEAVLEGTTDLLQGAGIREYAEICRSLNCGGKVPGVQHVHRIGAGASAALVGRVGRQCVVGFRGTVNWGGVAEDIMSGRLVPLPGCPGCRVGSGFLSGYRSLARRIKGGLRSLGCKRVSITGHSLGAAEAVLAAYDLSHSGFKITTSYTFGEPRVGNRAFHRAFQAALRGASFFRVVHGLDPIVQLGPLGSVTHEGSRIYEAGFNVFTDHLHYAGVNLTPCAKNVVIRGIEGLLR